MFRRLFFLLPLFLVATAPARDKPEDWMEVRSPHFVVVSNAGEKQTRNVAGQFERMRAVFQKALPRVQVGSGSPITVIAVKNEKDFRALEPEAYLAKGQLKLGGLFLYAADQNFVLLRLDAGGEHPYASVYHEYTHFLTRKAQDWLPLWLNEGFAEFYENTDIHDKDVVLGQPSVANIYLLRQNRLLPLATLFAVDRTSSYYHEENKGSIFYAESWALTHYLMIRDLQAKTTKLSDYMALLGQKVDPVVAATRAFGDLKALQKVLDNYVGQSRFMELQLPGPITVNDAEFKVRPLTSAQANAVRGEFLAYNERTADARALIEAALRDDPNNAMAQETMGYLEFRQRHLEEARKWYEKAVKLDSQSYLAHYYFAVIAMGEAGLDPDADAQIESSLRTAIKLNPSFAPAYDRLAAFLGMRRQNLEEAHMLSLNAIQLDPANVLYRMNSANILLASERGEDAIRVLQAALKLAKSPEEIDRVQASLQMAEQYQAAKQASEAPSQRATEAVTASETKVLAERPSGNQGESLPPGEERPAGFAPGPRRALTGTIRDVQCSVPAKMDLKLEAREGTIVLHADNYYKLQFSVLGFTPSPEFHPCTDLEGKRARIEFVESAVKTKPGQIKSVELRK